MNPLPGDLFARRLRQEREHQGISQAELARRVAAVLGSNVDPTAVTRIEQQARAVRLDEAVAMAQALDVPLSMLLVDDPDAEHDARMQELVAELTIAQREWELARRRVTRLTRAIQTLGGMGDEELPDDLAESIDARVPLRDPDEKGPTAPGA